MLYNQESEKKWNVGNSICFPWENEERPPVSCSLMQQVTVKSTAHSYRLNIIISFVYVLVSNIFYVLIFIYPHYLQKFTIYHKTLKRRLSQNIACPWCKTDKRCNIYNYIYIIYILYILYVERERDYQMAYDVYHFNHSRLSDIPHLLSSFVISNVPLSD